MKTRSRRKRVADAPLIALERCSLVLDDHTILDEVSFELRAGERWALVGPNGSGKTFLLKMLRGDVWPTPIGPERRRYRLHGRTVNVPAGSKEYIAYLGPEQQDKYLRYDWDFTVTQIVTTGLFDEERPLTNPSAPERARVARLLKRFGLWRLRERRLLSMSTGQQRLTLVARAFAGKARVLLLDEVFNGLDTRVRARLKAALEVPSRGQGPDAWVLTTHRVNELPQSITHLARIGHGRIHAAGPYDPADSVHHGNPAVAPLASRAIGPHKASALPLLRIQNADVYRDYRLVLKNLNWTIERGEHWAVIGANGSGKSTLLNLIYGDLQPAYGGTIERRAFKPGTHIENWKRRVGWVSPELQALQYVAGSVREIVISGRYSSIGLNAASTAADLRVANRWLEFFGLQRFADRKPRQVSYGQLRLALIARAMVNEPELLLLDEPCTGLDPDVRGEVLRLLQELAQSGTQIIMAVHDQEDIIPSIHHVLHIKRGVAVQSREADLTPTGVTPPRTRSLHRR